MPWRSRYISDGLGGILHSEELIEQGVHGEENGVPLLRLE